MHPMMEIVDRGQRIIQDVQEITGALLLAREALTSIAAVLDDPTECRDWLDVVERIRRLVDDGFGD